MPAVFGRRPIRGLAMAGSEGVMVMDISTTEIASPCIGVCTIDPQTEVCSGCMRTLDEIAGWRDADASARLAILDRIDERRSAGHPTT